MATGFLGTFMMILLRPVNPSLVLAATGFTVLGVLLGSGIDLVAGTRS
jgi:hypothetical protein